MFQYFGLFLVVSSWLGGYLLVSKWYDKSLPTISMHAASNKSASRLFAVVLIVLGLAFYSWLIEWFMPHLRLTFMFQAILSVAILCQCIAAIIPDASGGQRTVHRWAAYVMAILYLPLSVLVVISPRLTLLAQILCSSLLAYMFIGFALVAIMGKAKSRYLLFQSSYIIAFELIIVVAAYIS